jgi:dUTP pyrophosphatase
MVLRTGIALEIPEGYECQMRPRSGLSLSSPLRVTLGTIDSDYRGEVHIIVDNISSRNYQVLKGTRLAQLVIHKVEVAGFLEATELSDTKRGSCGFGSTGV